MRKRPEEVTLQVKFKYADGSYKTVPYVFKNRAAYDKWFEKAEANQTVRKVINKGELESTMKKD